MEGMVLLVRVAGGRYGIDLKAVQEVVATPRLDPLPRAEPWVRGLFNLRGNIATAVDLATLVGAPPAEAPRRGVVVDLQGSLLALLVEAADDVVTVRSEDVRAVPHETPGTAGVVLLESGPLILLDLPALLERRTEVAA